MSTPILLLPSSRGSEREDLLQSLDDIYQAGLTERNPRQVGWWVTEAYVRGIRDMFNPNYENGELDVSWESPDGELHLRWDEALTTFQTEIGRLSRLDIGPLVDKRVNSLESLRNASLSQIFLDSAVGSPDQQNAIKLRLLVGLVLYGTYGIAFWPDWRSNSPLDFYPETIPPWELLPGPAGSTNQSDLRLICRSRLFPLNELLAGYRGSRTRLPDADSADWEIIEQPYGTNQNDLRMNSMGTAGVTTGNLYDSGGNQKTGRRGLPETSRGAQAMVKLKEFWTLGPNWTMARYIKRAGSVIAEDVTFDGPERVPCPIGIARYGDTGHFYGRSLADKVIPLYLEFERFLERIIENSADDDRLGLLTVPNGLGFQLDDFKASESPRIATYDPDLGRDTPPVGQIKPATLSDVPPRMMQFGLGLLDRLTAQGPLFSGVAPGRADSGESFNVLGEMGSTHLRPVADSINGAFSACYRRILYDIGQRVESGRIGFPEGGIPLPKVDNSLAGVTIKPQTGMAVVGPGTPMPNPWALSISIRSIEPSGQERRRTEALQFLRDGLLNITEFIVMNYQEGWNYPIGRRNVWENYVKAVLVNLMLFGDGETPGELPHASNALPGGEFFNARIDIPEVHLQAMEDFVAGPAFMLASAQVRNAFTEKLDELKSRSPGSLPQGLEPMEQAAMRQPV